MSRRARTADIVAVEELVEPAQNHATKNIT